MLSSEEAWLRNVLIPHCLSSGKLIKNYVENTSSQILIKRILIRFLTTQEAFMLTVCYKAQVLFEYNGEEYDCALVVKKTPNVPEEVYEGVGFDSLYYNEIKAYTKIIPQLPKYSEKYPKYFYSHRKKFDSVLVLGDFSIEGWKMARDRVNLSLEHTLLAVKNLGRFHGMCYALKHEKPTKFFDLIRDLREPRFSRIPPPNWNAVLKTCSKRTINATKQYSNLPNEFLEKLSILISDVFNYCKIMVEPEEPIAILCHGDYLRNNLAFRYDNNTNPEIPTEVMMFDFQTLRYSSPMIDLCTFMSVSTGPNVRPKYFDSIFKCYWDELKSNYIECIENSNSVLPEFLSIENMLKEYIRYLPYGLSIASSFLMTLHDPGEMLPSDVLNDTRSEEEIIENCMIQGGEIVNKELSALVVELYDFISSYNVDIFEKCNI